MLGMLLPCGDCPCCAVGTLEPSAVLHPVWHIKRRLFGHGCVANPRDTFGYRCGLRLALTKNPSVLFVRSRMHHCTSSGPCAAAFDTTVLPAGMPAGRPWPRGFAGALRAHGEAMSKPDGVSVPKSRHRSLRGIAWRRSGACGAYGGPEPRRRPRPTGCEHWPDCGGQSHRGAPGSGRYAGTRGDTDACQPCWAQPWERS